MKFLLDTNTASFAMRGVGDVAHQLEKTPREEVCISTVTEAELWFGVRKRKSKKLENIVRDFLAPLQKVGFSSDAAIIFGKIYSELEGSGKGIGTCDTMIASIALEMNLILVTDNTKHFERVKGLKLDNWK
jgi:tRNA(fMet)-specific endonuclease VapC